MRDMASANDLRHAENRGRKATQMALAIYTNRPTPVSRLYTDKEFRAGIEDQCGCLAPVSDETWFATIGIYRALITFANSQNCSPKVSG